MPSLTLPVPTRDSVRNEVASGQRPYAIAESRLVSPDVLLVLGKDFSRPEVAKARTAIAETRDAMGGLPVRERGQNDQALVLRVSRTDAYKLAHQMEETAPGQADAFRKQLDDPITIKSVKRG